MHIPENYLSPVSCAVMGAAMIPVWVHAVKKTNKELPKEKLPLLGAGAAFSFLAMMFNVPLVGGTTGHAVPRQKRPLSGRIQARAIQNPQNASC